MYRTKNEIKIITYTAIAVLHILCACQKLTVPDFTGTYSGIVRIFKTKPWQTSIDTLQSCQFEVEEKNGQIKILGQSFDKKALKDDYAEWPNPFQQRWR